MDSTIEKEGNSLPHNTTEEWEEEFNNTHGLGLYTSEYGYVHKIPNYEAIKQFISKIYNKDIDIDEIKKESHNLALQQVVEVLKREKDAYELAYKKIPNETSYPVRIDQIDDLQSIITSLQKE